jgi:hypothetical protein
MRDSDRTIFDNGSKEKPLAPWYLSTWFLVAVGLVGLCLLAWFVL